MRTSELSRPPGSCWTKERSILISSTVQVLQVGERGVAGAEVVDRDAHAEAAQALHLDPDRGQVCEQHRLGELEAEPARLDAAGAERLGDVLDEAT